MAGVETGQEVAPPTKAETFRRFRQFNEELKLKLQKPLKEGDTWLVIFFSRLFIFFNQELCFRLFKIIQFVGK
jgi:hypothetical protein